MERLKITLNGNIVTITPVKDQKDLFRINVEALFAGYYDVTGQFTNYSKSLTQEDINFIEQNIKEAYSSSKS